MKRKRIPVWLRGLGRVKADLSSERWPSETETFREGIELIGLGLRLAGRKSRARNLACFSKADQRWIDRWKEERAHVFGE